MLALTVPEKLGFGAPVTPPLALPVVCVATVPAAQTIDD